MGWSIYSAGSDCWAGCGGSYELSCRGSLALVDEEGEASGACADRACAGGACTDGDCIGGACADEACVGGACAGKACADEACAGRACVDVACVDIACTDGAVVVARVGRLGRGLSFKAYGLITFS